MMKRTTITAAFLALSTPSLHAASFDCVVDPERVIKLGSPVMGLLTEVLVERGQTVARGAVVARIESSVEAATVAFDKEQAENKAGLQEKEARLTLAQKALERAHGLARTENIAPKLVDEAESEVRVLGLQVENERSELEKRKLELARAQAILDLKTIRSPENGVVTERTLSGGEFVYQESHIFTIARLDELRVETFLPVALYGQVVEGDTGLVEPEAPIGGQYSAKVTVVDHVFDAASGTFGVRLALANPSLKLPAGMRCKVTFPQTHEASQSR
jgi:RND family efflux transporter MFP subunit